MYGKSAIDKVNWRRDDTRNGRGRGVRVKGEVVMKFVLAWTTRPGGSGADLEAANLRVLALFSNWAPHSGETIHQFVARADANGGFAVVETDNLAGLALDSAKFAPYLEFSVYPVVDIQEGAAILAEAAEFRRSVS
jgi:hypothetical protein